LCLYSVDGSCVWVRNMVSCFATRVSIEDVAEQVPSGAPTLGGGNKRIRTFQPSQPYNWGPILLGCGLTSLGVWCLTFRDSLVVSSSLVACLMKIEHSTLQDESTTLPRKVGRQLPSDRAPCRRIGDTPTKMWLRRAYSWPYVDIMRRVESGLRTGRLEIAYVRNFSCGNIHERDHVGVQDVGVHYMST